MKLRDTVGVAMFRYVRSDSVVSRVIAGETLVIPVRKGIGDLASIYSLNPVATAIWQVIENPRSTAEIADVIEQDFESSRQQIERDVQSFLAEMSSTGLVCAIEAAA